MYDSKTKKKQIDTTTIQKKSTDTKSTELTDNRVSKNISPQLVTQLAHGKGKRKSTKQKHQKGERQLQAAQMQARWRQLYNSNFSKGTPFCKNWIRKNRAAHGEDYSKWTRQKM